MNAIFNLPTPIRIAGVLLVLWLLWDIFRPIEPEQTVLRQKIHRHSDYAMTDFTTTFMNESGLPVRIVHGKKMLHFPEDDSTEIFDPVTEFFTEGKDNWTIQSQHGHTQGKRETILLTGNVIISNQNDPDFKLLTEQLTLDMVNETAYTDEAVTILSQQGETRTVGLHAALNDETINLHSRVRGHYNAPTAQ